MTFVPTERPATGYVSQSATDAWQDGESSFTRSYCDYLETAALKHFVYYTDRGQPEMADLMLTRSFAQALMGNDGD